MFQFSKISQIIAVEWGMTFLVWGRQGLFQTSFKVVLLDRNWFWPNIYFLKIWALRHFRPRDTSGPKLLDTSGRKTLPAVDISGPKPWDKSGPETCLALRQVRTSLALRHFRPWDMSGPETSQDKSGIETFPAPRHFSKKKDNLMIDEYIQFSFFLQIGVLGV